MRECSPAKAGAQAPDGRFCCTSLGVGGALLAHLVATARAMGLTRLSLETGNSPLFSAANRLYLRDGLQSCGPFGDYANTPFTLFYTREI